VSGGGSLSLAALAKHLVPARQLESRERRGRLGTGSEPLDRLLGGGWPRGAVSELCGRHTSGRTAVLLGSLAAALRRGEAAALVDVAGALDPGAALRAGVPLERLLWVRLPAPFWETAGRRRATTVASYPGQPGTPPEASGQVARTWVRKPLAAAELIVAAGGFGMVAIDLGEQALGVPTQAWVRLKRLAAAQGTVILVVTARRLEGVLGACALTLSDAQPHFATEGAAKVSPHAPPLGGGDGLGPSGAPAPSRKAPPLLLGVQIRAFLARNVGARAHEAGGQPVCTLNLQHHRS
jgi:hypothetical protein